MFNRGDVTFLGTRDEGDAVEGYKMGSDYIHLWAIVGAYLRRAVVYFYDTIIDHRNRVQVARLSLTLDNAIYVVR